MNRSSPLAALSMIGAAMLLSGYSGGGRVVSGPPTVAYVCEDGRPATAIYENGGDYLHAKVMLTYDGRTSELGAAPTLFGTRYVGEPEGTARLAWSLRGERAWLTQVQSAEDVITEGTPVALCTRLRGGGDAGHGEGHEEGAH